MCNLISVNTSSLESLQELEICDKLGEFKLQVI